LCHISFVYEVSKILNNKAFPIVLEGVMLFMWARKGFRG